MSRIVTLVLVDGGGDALGALPPFTVPTPWWPEVAEIVEHVHGAYGIDVVVLRLLDAVADPRDPFGMGGSVTYVAELVGGVDPPASLGTWSGTLDDHPLRAGWARPGGPAADVSWAAAALARLGRPVMGPALQLKTWNLSSIWRLDTADGRVWIKVVPPFFAHEGRILDALSALAAPVPTVLAFDGARMLMADIPGEDQYHAAPELLARMVDLLVELQLPWLGRSAELVELGLHDWRRASFISQAIAVVDRAGHGLGGEVARDCSRLLATLDERMASIESCGLPATLVHGDFHPGNLRYDGSCLVLLDWGDCGVGHPLLDLPAFLDRVPESEVPALRSRWLAAWAAAVPGSDPGRAAELMAPVAALRQAIIYRRFLDGIEPSERIYHETDVPAWLGRAATLAQMHP
jgi:hypothetical protein